MDNLNTNGSDQDSDLPAGFLIKDKSGQFKKVQDGTIVDFTVKKPVASPPASAELPRSVPSQTVRPPAAPAQSAISPLRTPLPVRPPAPISSSPNASIFMAPDDELEIRAHQEKLNSIMEAPAGHSVLSVEDIVSRTINDFQLTFSDEVMQKRFAKVIESRLRDLRDSVETAEVLTRSKKIGGLEIPKDQAEKILSSIEKHITEKPLIRPSAPVVASMPTPDVPPAFIPRPQPVRPSSTVPPVTPAPEDISRLAEEIKREIQTPAPAPKPAPTVPVAPAPVSTPDLYIRPIDEMPRIVQVRRPEMERPQVIDIKQPAKVLGPVEELADIDLDEFRRQGTNPTEAAERILEKIDLLEHDSWTMKIEATKAWRRSAANQLYVQIGRESMESNQTVAETIRKRMQNSQSYLLLDEFLAINSLNSRLAI